jgi:hypothetical protein
MPNMLRKALRRNDPHPVHRPQAALLYTREGTQYSEALLCGICPTDIRGFGWDSIKVLISDAYRRNKWQQ